MKISILTPTYNRGNLLKKLYEKSKKLKKYIRNFRKNNKNAPSL